MISILVQYLLLSVGVNCLLHQKATIIEEPENLQGARTPTTAVKEVEVGEVVSHRSPLPTGVNKPRMNIIQWNCASYYAQFEQLKLVIKENNSPACLCLQETRHKGKKFHPPSGYIAICSTNRRDDDHERGVAMLVNKNINFKELKLQTTTNIEAVAARVWLGRFYTICSIYLSPSLTVNETELLNLINQLPKPFLLLGDMNARHYRWGEHLCNDRGNLFEKILLEQDVTLLNEEEKTHYSVQHGSSTLIDLSLCSTDCFPDFACSVQENLYGSDHYPIQISTTAAPVLGEPSLRFKTHKADWNKFRILTANYVKPHNLSNIDIDEAVEHFTSFIIEAAKSSIPISTNRKNDKIPIPWWNEDCEKAKIERKRAERALKRNKTLSNKIAYRRCDAICKKTFKEARKTS